MANMNLKLRKIGNSLGIIIPKEYLEGYNEGSEIGIVITSPTKASYNKPLLEDKVITKDLSVAAQWCNKHDARKGTCGCK